MAGSATITSSTPALIAHLLDPYCYGTPNMSGRTMRRFADLLPFNTGAFTTLLDAIPKTDLKLTEYKGAKLFLKNETLLPTRTTKDRMAVSALASMLSDGVAEFVVSSTGNLFVLVHLLHGTTRRAHQVSRLCGEVRGASLEVCESVVEKYQR